MECPCELPEYLVKVHQVLSAKAGNLWLLNVRGGPARVRFMRCDSCAEVVLASFPVDDFISRAQTPLGSSSASGRKVAIIVEADW
jgi:hypothetical protein